MTWKKRIISIALCLCALLCAASVRAEATGAHSHPICGANHKDIGNHTSDNCSTPTWTAWNGGDITYDTNNVAYIYLSQNVTTSNDIIVPQNKTLYLCLNGHSLTRKASNYTIYVEGTLVLCDCNGSKQGKGAISHGKEEDGSFCGTEGVYVMKNATFTMYGGKICNNNGGVLVCDGTFTMYDGEISGNTRTADTSSNSSGGGGVCVKKYWKGGQDIGKFYMYGGKICNNTYKGPNLGGGGVYASGTGDFIIQGGTITDNQCSYNGTNTSNGAFGGGGLHITGQHSSLEISNNTVISNNTCEGHGGGIFVIGGEGGSITNCTISGNSAAGKGGAICLMTDDAYVTLSSGLNFSGNAQGCTADENGKLTGGTANDVFLHTGAYLRLASDFSKTSTAPIVVTTASEPDAYGGYKKIAEGSASVAKTTDFTYGNDSTIGIIAKTNNGKVELLACKHNYSTQKDETNHWQECSICKDKKDVTKHTYSNTWKKNSTQHWHECECGAKSGEADHAYSNEWKTGDGKHWHECACGQKSGEAEHSYSTAWKIGDGKHWHECVCGQKSEEAEHSYSTAWDRDNTSHFHKCSACGDKTDIAICVYTARVTSSHQKSDATCTAKAVYWKSCVCDRESTETFESGETNPDKHAGTLGGWQSNDDGHWKEYSCCQTKVQEGKHTWNKGEVTTSPTCTAAGVKTYTCAVCSAKKTEEIQVTGHAWDTEWSKDNDHHWHKCKNCDAIIDLTAHVPGAAATETTPQLCTECGYVIAPATHPVHTWVFVAETPATCNAAGEREHYKCTCGRTSFKNGDVYDINEDASVLTIAANHTGNIGEQWHSDSANHWQEYTCCHARANEAAHSGGAATCTAQAVCQVCGKAYGPLAAHAWQPATCTAPKTCSVCHVTDGAALGHDWGAWKVTTPATKDAPGVETRTCTHNSAHTETRSIPKLSTTVYTVSEDTKIAQIEAKVDGLDKILESDENKALVNDGKSVGVSLTVKNTASSGVSEKIKEKLAGSNLVGLRLELTVERTVTANGVVESKQTIHDAGVLLKTTITLPAELQGKSGYVVYRLHDENVHVLTETANENGEFISVSADKTQITICARLYSEYVIAYQTGGSSGGGYHPVNPTPVKATSANTGDAGVLLYGVTAALSLTGTAWLGAKSKKH